MDTMLLCVSCGQPPRGGRFLKCLHVACSACVDEHTHSDGSRLCPRCTSTTESQPGGQLPRAPECLTDGAVRGSDHYHSGDSYAQWSGRNDRVASSAAAAAEQHLCDECIEDKPATHRCEDCDSVLCSRHAGSHPKRRRFVGHRVEELSAAAHRTLSPTEQLPTARPRVETMCPLHTHLPSDKYCKSCREVACSRCLATGAHGDSAKHEVVAVGDYAAEWLQELVKLFGAPGSEPDDVSRATSGNHGVYVPKKGDGDDVSLDDDDADHLDGGLESDVAVCPYTKPAAEWGSLLGIQSIQNEVESVLDSVLQQHETLSQAVGGIFEKVRAQLDQNEARLHTKIDQMTWHAMKPLEDQKEALNQSMLACERAISLLQFCSAQTEQTALLLRLSKWLLALKERCDVMGKQIPHVKQHVQFNAQLCETSILAFNIAESITDRTVAAWASTARVHVLPPSLDTCEVRVAVCACTADGRSVVSWLLSNEDAWHVDMTTGSGGDFTWRVQVHRLPLSTAVDKALGERKAKMSAKPKTTQEKSGKGSTGSISPLPPATAAPIAVPSGEGIKTASPTPPVSAAAKPVQSRRAGATATKTDTATQPATSAEPTESFTFLNGGLFHAADRHTAGLPNKPSASGTKLLVGGFGGQLPGSVAPTADSPKKPPAFGGKSLVRGLGNQVTGSVAAELPTAELRKKPPALGGMSSVRGSASQRPGISAGEPAVPLGFDFSASVSTSSSSSGRSKDPLPKLVFGSATSAPSIATQAPETGPFKFGSSPSANLEPGSATSAPSIATQAPETGPFKFGSSPSANLEPVTAVGLGQQQSSSGLTSLQVFKSPVPAARSTVTEVLDDDAVITYDADSTLRPSMDLPGSLRVSFSAVFSVPRRFFCTPITVQVRLNGKPISCVEPQVVNIAYDIAGSQFGMRTDKRGLS
eukprot:scpid27515/ scgid0940/ 